MIRHLDATFRVAGLDAPVTASIAFDRTSYGGIDHYILGVGHSGRLLAAYRVHVYRGAVHLMDPVSATHNAPAEVTRAACNMFAAAFAAIWNAPRAIDAADEPPVATRAMLAHRANLVACDSRRRAAPVLSHDSAPETVAAWLQWNDPNGSHTADRATADDLDPYTEDTAWTALASALEDC